MKRFDKIALAPGERKTVTFTLDRRCFAAWDTRTHGWYAEDGDYAVQICRDAETVLLEARVRVTPVHPYKPVFTPNSSLGDILRTPKGQAILGAMMSAAPQQQQQTGDGFISSETMDAMINSILLRQLMSFTPDFTPEAMNALLDQLNN